MSSSSPATPSTGSTTLALGSAASLISASATSDSCSAVSAHCAHPEVERAAPTIGIRQREPYLLFYFLAGTVVQQTAQPKQHVRYSGPCRNNGTVTGWAPALARGAFARCAGICRKATFAMLTVTVLIGCDGEERAAAIPESQPTNAPIGADARVPATGIAVDRSKARYDSDVVAVDETQRANVGSFVVSRLPSVNPPPASHDERPPLPTTITRAAPPPPNIVSWLLGLFRISGPE